MLVGAVRVDRGEGIEVAMLVSPAEPRPFKVLGRASPVTEEWGCDFLWWAHGKPYGVQRKEVKDLVASVRDGRLGKELGQAARVLDAGGMLWLIVEGEVTWSGGTGDATLQGGWWQGAKMTRAQWDGVLWRVARRGWVIESTHGHGDTIACLERIEAWTRRGDRGDDGLGSMGVRGGPVSVWGRATNREWMEWFLTGLPGIGEKRAKKIVAVHGGGVVRLGIDEGELASTVGKVTARKIVAVFDVRPGER